MPEWAHSERGTLGRLKRLAGREKQYCHPIEWRETVETPIEDVNGVLMQIIPYQESEGVRSGVELLRSLHEEYTRDINSFEVWFHEGQIRFYIYAADHDAADKVRRKVRGSYPDAQVVTLDGGAAFPAIHESEHVAGATMIKEDSLDYLPIRRYDDDEWEHDDPYTQVLGAMLADDRTRVVIQGVMQAVPKTWTDGVRDLAEDLRAPDVKGWIREPYEVPASRTDEIRAEIIEEQDRKPAFEVNLRVLAISPNPKAAANRAQGVASSYSTYYDTRAKQGLRPAPITGRAPTFQRARMKKHIDRMRYRQIESARSCHMTFKELGGVCHIPSGDIPTQYIEWKRTRSGGEIPTDAPLDSDSSRHENENEDDDHGFETL